MQKSQLYRTIAIAAVTLASILHPGVWTECCRLAACLGAAA